MAVRPGNGHKQTNRESWRGGDESGDFNIGLRREGSLLRVRRA